MSGTVGTNSGRVSGSIGSAGSGITTDSSDPTVSTNPPGGVGTVFSNTTSGETYVCSDDTAGSNVWKNVGEGSGDIQPANWYGTRGAQGGGHFPTVATIQYITIATIGDALDFGASLANGAKRGVGGFSSGSAGRGVFIGGSSDSSAGNSMEYITMLTTGACTDFGNLLQGAYIPGDVGNGTRGVKVGGEGGSPYYNGAMDFVTIATTGDAADFGDMHNAGARSSGVMDGTYGLNSGISSYPTIIGDIEIITVATEGNASDWGYNQSLARNSGCAVSSNAGRGIWAGGTHPGGPTTTTIDYVTISSGADAQDFGDLTVAGQGPMCASMSGTRGVFMARATPGTNATIDYITMASIGNALDFGNLYSNRYMAGGVSGG